MRHTFSTGEVAPARRLTHWTEMINELFVPLDVAPLGAAGAFSGSVTMSTVGELTVARVAANPMSARHSLRHIDSSAEDDYFVALHVRGIAYAKQDGRDAVLRAGDFALFDSTRPYAIEFRGDGSFEHLIYRVPRAALEARCENPQGATAVPVPLSSGEGRLTAPYLSALSTLAAPLAGASAERLSATALDLLATALAAAAREPAGARAPSHSMLARAKQRTLARLADADLTPAEVADASFISTRQLHRLFAADGTTFGTFLREERLRRCRADLADPRRADEPIAAIAARWGCRSPAHFTRIFTARYGLTPRAFRRAAADGGHA